MAAPGKVAAFPNGASSYGWPVLPAMGPQTWGGGGVLWVGNRSGLPAGDGSSPAYPLSSVFTATTGAFAKIAARSAAQGGTGGTIHVLPGHVETIAASTNLSTIGGSTATGVNIIGWGTGLQRPTFNWTATASALLINLAGTWVRNCFFNLAKTAATVVTAAITASAADCGFMDVEMLPATSATQLTTTAFTVATGATRFGMVRTNIYSETFATNPTDIITTTAAVDKVWMQDCELLTAVNATTSGVVNFVNAPTNLSIKRCTFNNKKALSTKCAVFSASTTGTVEDCAGIIQSTGAAAAFGTLGNLVLKECYAGTLGTASILIGTPST